MAGNFVESLLEQVCGLADARRSSGARLEETMEPAKNKAWHRFREQLLHDHGWPREVWFTEIEDGLRAALGDASPLLSEFRRDRAELEMLERQASGSYQDERRIGQLEEQIRQLAALADRTATRINPDPAPPRQAAPEPFRPTLEAVPPPPGRYDWPRRVLVLAFGMMLVALGAAGASFYYETQRTAEAERQMARIDQLLEQQAAGLRAELDQRLAADREGSSETPDALRARSAAAARALDGLSLDVSSLGMRLPVLGNELDGIAADAGQMADDLARADAEVDSLRAASAELTAWLAQQQDELERIVQGRRESLSDITGRVQGLAVDADLSQTLLTDLKRALVESLHQAGQDGETLRNAVEEMRATGLEVAKLMDGAEAKVQAAQATMQRKIDEMLSNVAEQADLAVLRGNDVIGRAEGEIARRVEATSTAALDAIVEEREAQLAALAQQVSATQAELERTRASLLASWRRMDQSVIERQTAVLTSLDAYAGTIGVRVEELLQALDVIVGGAGG
jgi:hypothetical protein